MYVPEGQNRCTGSSEQSSKCLCHAKTCKTMSGRNDRPRVSYQSCSTVVCEGVSVYDHTSSDLPSDSGLEVFDGVTSSPPPHTGLFALHHRVHDRLHPLIVQTPSLYMNNHHGDLTTCTCHVYMLHMQCTFG